MADAGKVAYFFERWLKYSVKYQRKRFCGVKARRWRLVGGG